MNVLGVALPELATLRLYGLGWPSLTPATVTCYFSEVDWQTTATLKLWLVEGQLKGRLVGSLYHVDRPLGTTLLGSEPPLVPMNRPSWCENPLLAAALFPDGVAFAWHTRRPVSITLREGAFVEYVI